MLQQSTYLTARSSSRRSRRQDWESHQIITWNVLCSPRVLAEGEGRDKGYHIRRIVEKKPDK